MSDEIRSAFSDVKRLTRPRNARDRKSKVLDQPDRTLQSGHVDTGVGFDAEVLGLTTEEDPSGSAHADRGPLLRSNEVRERRSRAGAGPASEASVRAEGPCAQRGERARLDVSARDAAAGAGLTAPASGQQDAPSSVFPAVSPVHSLLPPEATALVSADAAHLPPGATCSATRAIASRVDALVIAFKTMPRDHVVTELGVRGRLAAKCGRAELRLPPFSLELVGSRREGVYPIQNADLRGVFDMRGRGGWTLEVVLRATFLAAHELENAIALARTCANAFGGVAGERLRRFDLAVDLVGFPLREGDARHMFSRAGVVDFSPEAKDVDEVSGEMCKPSLRVYRDRKRVVTGLVVSQGNPLSMRLYDKTAELRLPGREAKREIEEALWAHGGWTPLEPVTRTELQCRSECLDEMSLREPDKLMESIDAVWSYGVKWARLVRPGKVSRRKRAKLDPRWQALRDFHFRHGAQPIVRHRNRGGALPEHVFGTARSRLASIGALAPIPLGITEDGEILDEETFVDRMTTAEQSDWLQQTLCPLFQAAAKDVIASLTAKYGLRGAALRAVTSINASTGRFRSVDDGPNT